MAENVLKAQHLSGDLDQRQALSQRYDCNPLVLKIVATSIHELFEGDISAYLAEGAILPRGIQWFIDQQFARLTELEKTICYWLAISREWTSIDELEADIWPRVEGISLLRSLESLRWRSLIQQKGSRYTQQPVVMEHMLKRLLDKMSAEITEGFAEISLASPTIAMSCKDWSYLSRFSLSKTTVRDYIYESQMRLIVKRLSHLLASILPGSAALETTLNKDVKAVTGDRRASPAGLWHGQLH